MFDPRIFLHRKAVQSASRKIVLLIVSCLLCITAPQTAAFAQSQQQELQQEQQRQREEQRERQQEQERQREEQQTRQQEQERQREEQQTRQQEQERQREQQQQRQEQERQREQQRQSSNASTENNNRNNNGSDSRSTEPNATTTNSPSHTYTPGRNTSSSGTGAAHTYTPEASASGSAYTYTPGASTSGSVHTYTPGSNASSPGTGAPHTYTPGASTSGSAHTYTPSASSSVNPSTSAQGVTTYAPHANGSGAARIESESRDGSRGVGVTSSNGVTTYRPQAQPSAEGPQGQMRFGGCAKLTGDSACKVCQNTGPGSWVCKSNTVWQEIPGNDLPVAGQPQPSNGLRKVGGGDTQSAPGRGSAGTGGNASIGSGRQVVPGTPSSGGLAPAGCTPQGAPGDGPAGAGSSSNCGSQATGIGAASSGAYPSGVGYQNSLGASQQAGSGGVSAGSPVTGDCVPGDGPAGGGCNGNVQTSAQAMGTGTNTADAVPESGNQGSGGEGAQVGAGVGCGAPGDGPAGTDSSANCGAESQNSDSVSKPLSCDELMNYRDNQLEKELNLAVYKRDVYKAGKEKQFENAQDTLNLMNHEWLMGETGAQIAIEVKFVADEVSVLLGFFGEPRIPMRIPKVTPADIISGAGPTVGIIRSYVEDGAQKASDDGAKAAIWRIAEELNPLVAVAHGLADLSENEEGLQDSKDEIQKQAAAIVETARKFNDKEKEEQSKADSLAKIKQSITDYCAPQAVINLAPR
jgi:hypothetical protein